MRSAARLLMAGLILATSGCLGSLEPDYLMTRKRVEKIRETADWYAANLRWGRLQHAAAMVRDEDRKDFIATFVDDPHPRVEFTGWEIITVEQAEERDEAEVWVSYEYFVPPAIRPRTITERQVWHYEASTRVWRVQPDLTVFPMYDPEKLTRDLDFQPPPPASPAGGPNRTS